MAADSNLYKNDKRTLNEKYVDLKLFKNYFLFNNSVEELREKSNH